MTAAHFSQARPLSRWALRWRNVRGCVKLRPSSPPTVPRDLGRPPLAPSGEAMAKMYPPQHTQAPNGYARGKVCVSVCLCVPAGVCVSPLPPGRAARSEGGHRERGETGEGWECVRVTQPPPPPVGGRARVEAANGKRGGSVSGMKGGLGRGPGGGGGKGGVGEN